MLAALRERDATGKIAAIYDEGVGNTSALAVGGRRTHNGGPIRVVEAQRVD